MNEGMRTLGHTRIFSTVHRYAVQEEPKAKEDPSHYQKTLNPKRVMTGWSRGGSLALARRAAHDLLGRGATLAGGKTAQDTPPAKHSAIVP